MRFGKRKIHISLLPRVIIAIILSLIAGNFLPAFIVRVSITFNSLFSQFPGFMVPLIIIGLVTPADIGRDIGNLFAVSSHRLYSVDASPLQCRRIAFTA